ncbi:sugar O-acetyltransferase [Corynebacterium anserum]|nr:sugar O-acetyltransferase [Corynebacterium anserum]
MNTPGNVSRKLTEELKLTPEELTARVDKEKEDNPQAMLARMNAGLLYHASDPHIQELSLRGKSSAQQFNRLDLTDTDSREATLESLLATYPRSATIMAPLTVDYGHNIHIGENVFINFDAIFLDICPITIGNDCQIGPRAQFLAALHPMDNHALRASGWEYGAPITIGDNVWLGGGVTICPGVSIGNNSVIGAGSVVTRDIPDHCFAAGTPAKVMRKL